MIMKSPRTQKMMQMIRLRTTGRRIAKLVTVYAEKCPKSVYIISSTTYTLGIFVMWVSVYMVALGSNSFVFRNTRQAIVAIRGTAAVGDIALYIGGTNGSDVVIPMRIVIASVILTLH